MTRSPLSAKTQKPSKCQVCRAPYKKLSMTHKLCGAIDCGIKFAEKARDKRLRIAAKVERAATKAQIEARKGLSYWEGRTERACNAYIRARDPDVCISCGTTQSSAWQAGHYVSVGANSTLRYNSDNINKQCVQCNLHKGSNAIEYRIGLVAKIGLERVEALEAWHPPFKMTIEYCKELEANYKAKLKALK